MRRGIFVLMVSGLLFLSGCAIVSYTPYDLKEPARVAKNPSEVLIIPDSTKITKQYKEIGTISLESEWSSSEALMEDLRKEAAKRGADAVINIKDTSKNKFEVFGSWPYMSFNNATVRKVNGTIIIFSEEK